MRQVRIEPLKLALLLSAVLLHGCTTERSKPPPEQLPPEMPMNKEAGRGGLLVVNLRLQQGEELPFVVDTGAPGTLFDKSLTPKLGSRLPLGTWTVATLKENQKSGIYKEPKLYLGNSVLKTGSLTATLDCRELSSMAGHPIMGILGMDCLKHYCIQLDFEAGKMRFLPRGAPRPGKPFPLTFSFPGHQPSMCHPGLAGGKNADLQIDTGFNTDGQVEPGAVNAPDSGLARLPECLWDGESYSDLLVASSKGSSRLGLRFLARHLVTLDFPGRTMYLRRTRPGPLAGEDVQAAGNAAAKSAVEFLRRLVGAGHLPGWSKTDEVAVKSVAFEFHGLNSATCDHFLKKGDPSIYHYRLVRKSGDSPWELDKAWRTDKDGHVIEEYPIQKGASP